MTKNLTGARITKIASLDTYHVSDEQRIENKSRLLYCTQLVDVISDGSQVVGRARNEDTSNTPMITVSRSRPGESHGRGSMIKY